MKRRDFIESSLMASALILLPQLDFAAGLDTGKESDFARKLKPIGRALEMEGYFVWCNSPIYGPDGRVHVFISRWLATKGMGGWINSCEIGHAVANTPESEFKYVETILAPRGPGFWDATTCHNPYITFIDGKYCLFFMGNSNGKTDTKRIGLATAPTLDGPWTRPDAPLLLPGKEGAWDDHCTTNPALIKKDGKYMLFYKSWNTKEYNESTQLTIKGNRKYGMAIADKLEGPYIKREQPVLDFSGRGEGNKQIEDAYVWQEGNKIKIICRDMGIFNHENGLIMESKNGIKWTEPQIAFYELAHYIKQPAGSANLKRYGRVERPQLLMKDGKPEYLFTASQGGKYMTASSFIFKIEG
ncbi:glycoside hydrolase family protein [Pedobacter mucosus]|uniref:glycoside hydrolase family protein n=1 Tax=Pedobacter mucosus TaxID=2895286 RepID=UPI001EE412F1|nr:glycoside hydrolase family protein [Pedobacter mucosus]UKT62994.1 glycoside hydrolase family protein [Pedobacter mucosus]